MDHAFLGTWAGARLISGRSTLLGMGPPEPDNCVVDSAAEGSYRIWGVRWQAWACGGSESDGGIARGPGSQIGTATYVRSAFHRRYHWRRIHFVWREVKDSVV